MVNTHQTSWADAPRAVAAGAAAAVDLVQGSRVHIMETEVEVVFLHILKSVDAV